MYKNLSRLGINQLVLSNVCLGGYISDVNIRLKPFILGSKSNYHILDISYTHIQLKLLINVLINIISLRQKVLIVKDLDFYNLLIDFNYKNIFFYNVK
jgi:ribosomal protein S2